MIAACKASSSVNHAWNLGRMHCYSLMAEFTNEVQNYDHTDRAWLLDDVMTMTSLAMTSPYRSVVQFDRSSELHW